MERDGAMVKYVYVPKGERSLRSERVVTTIIDPRYYVPGSYFGGLVTDGILDHDVSLLMQQHLHMVNVVNQGPLYYQRLGNCVRWDYLQLRLMFQTSLNLGKSSLPSGVVCVRLFVLWVKPRFTARGVVFPNQFNEPTSTPVSCIELLNALFDVTDFDGKYSIGRLGGINPDAYGSVDVLLEENFTFNISRPVISISSGGNDVSPYLPYTLGFVTEPGPGEGETTSQFVPPYIQTKPVANTCGGVWNTHDDDRLVSRRISLAGYETLFHQNSSSFAPGLGQIGIDQSGSLLVVATWRCGQYDDETVLSREELCIVGSAEVGYYDK